MNQSSSPEITPELLEQHPELVFPIALLFGLLLFYLVGGIGSWIYFGSRIKAHLPLLRIEPWTPRAWGLMDIGIVLVSILLGQGLFAAVGVRLLGIDAGELQAGEAGIPIGLALWAGVGNVFAMLIATLLITLRLGVTAQHVGFDFQQLKLRSMQGILVGLATLPFIYILMVLVSAGFQTEYSHPLIEEMSQRGTLSVYLMGFVTAAVIAPVTEEFLFRVVIQGWLQSLPFKSALANILGSWRAEPSNAIAVAQGEVPEQNLAAPSSVSDGEWSREWTEPNRDSNEPIDSVQPDASAGAEQEFKPPVWPSILSGILFGLAHWAYGLSFVPLIALGIILGLVYRATHSIWPCIVIHGMLNATSMGLLGLSILIQRAAG